MLRWVLFVLFFGICATAIKQKAKVTKPPNLSRGWGDGITWMKTYEEGLSKMVESKKPLMVIHHREDCPHSKELKKAFLAKGSILKMAKEDFIMLNLVEEISDINMAPDGYYVPRILFVDPTMVVRNDIMGKHSDHRFNYRADDMELLKLNMMRAKLPLTSHTEL